MKFQHLFLATITRNGNAYTLNLDTHEIDG